MAGRVIGFLVAALAAATVGGGVLGEGATAAAAPAPAPLAVGAPLGLGTPGSDPGPTIELGGLGYFLIPTDFQLSCKGCGSSPTKAELYRTDGTEAGTTLVTEIPTEVDPGSLAVSGGRLVFQSTGLGSTVWTSDGTAAGTKPLVLARDFGQLAVVAPELVYVFGKREDNAPPVLTAIDPATGERRPALPSHLTAAASPSSIAVRPDGRLVVGVVGDQGLWMTGGRDSEASRIGPASWAAQQVWVLGQVGADTYVNVGGRIWRTDGTDVGTHAVSTADDAATRDAITLDVRPVATGAALLIRKDSGKGGTPARLLVVNRDGVHEPAVRKVGVVAATSAHGIFTAADDAGVMQVWSVDAAGRELAQLTRRRAGAAELRGGLRVAGSRAFFGDGGTAWTTDGTATGTAPLPSAVLGPLDGADRFTLVGGRIHFTGDDGVHGREPWVWEPGTAPRMVRDVDATPSVALGVKTAVFAGQRYLSVRRALFRTDGTAAGTEPVVVLPGDIAELVASTNGLFAVVYLPGTEESQLWWTDGTRATSRRLATVSTKVADGFRLLTPTRGGVAFTGPSTRGPKERAVWVSDGSVDGTRPVDEIPRADRTRSSKLGFLTAASGRAHYAWSADGWRLRAVDGRSTRPVRSVKLGARPTATAVDGATLYIGSRRSGARAKLWAVRNGRARLLATMPPRNPRIQLIRPLGRRIYVTTEFDGSSPYASKLWVLGPRGGPLRQLARTTPITGLWSVGSRLLFETAASYNLSTPPRVWASSGTANSTEVLARAPEETSLGDESIVTVGDRAFFMFTGEFDEPIELWRTDGTRAGTHHLADAPALGASELIDATPSILISTAQGLAPLTPNP